MAVSTGRFDIQTDEVEAPSSPDGARGLGGLLGDIRERAPSHTKPPSPPRLIPSNKGFPAHKARKLRAAQVGPRFTAGDQSARDAADQVMKMPATAQPTSLQSDIDRENRDRLAAMTEQEILDARRELESSLQPSIIKTLINRASIGNDQIEAPEAGHVKDTAAPRKPMSIPRTASGSNSVEDEFLLSAYSKREDLTSAVERPPKSPPKDLFPLSSKQSLPPVPEFHFPQPPNPPELDPNDPDFQEKLRSVYFPSLPSDPSSLSWMAPTKDGENDSYSPSSDDVAASSLRFDFRGCLLPPHLSSRIPSTKGLHHHGHAPGMAGYTIPELSHLARSVVASQQCIAYQTLGRILFRLGKGEFGSEGEPLHDGIWQLIDKGHALDSMIEAAAREEGGNRSVWATATDGVWLFRKGGGVKWRGR